MKNIKTYSTSILSLIVAVSLLTGCSSGNQTIPKTGNKTLDSLLASAPATIINLRDQPVDTLYATPKNRLGTTIVDSLNTLPVFGNVVGIVKVGNRLYVADRKRHCIWAVNSHGTIVQKIGRKGKGPGEFLSLMGIMKNHHYIYTADFSNARIIRFNNNMVPNGILHTVIFGNSLAGIQSMDATDSLLYLPTSFFTHQKLIEIRHAAPPFDSVGAFLPRLIPPGMQPAYNGYKIDTNSRGNIAISYDGLPYVFLFNKNHKLKHILYLKFPKKVAPDNPSPKPVHDNSPRGIGISGLISNLTLTDNRRLYVSVGSHLYGLKAGIDQNLYGFKKTWFFASSDPKKRKDISNPLNNIAHALVVNHSVYLWPFRGGAVYRFSLKE